MLGAEIAGISGSTHSDDKEKEPESEPHVDDGSDIPTIDTGYPRAREIEHDDKIHHNGIGPEGTPFAGKPIWSNHEKGIDPSIEPDLGWADIEERWHWRRDKLVADLEQLKRQNKKNNTPSNRTLKAPDGTTNNASEYDNLIGNPRAAAQAEERRKNLHKSRHDTKHWRHEHMDGDRDGGKNDYKKW
jgi:hypothetical protein